MALDVEKFIVHFDGSCEPINPGGIIEYGYTITQSDVVIRKESVIAFSGGVNATSNVSEYMALIACLIGILGSRQPYPPRIEIYGDSQLIINQMNGKWRAKAQTLKPLSAIASVMIEEIRSTGAKVILRWIPREQNKVAHELSKKIIKEARKDRLPMTEREKKNG